MMLKLEPGDIQQQILNKHMIARGYTYLSHILCPLFQLWPSCIGYKMAHSCQPQLVKAVHYNARWDFTYLPSQYICGESLLTIC